jgi:hypothetical protein
MILAFYQVYRAPRSAAMILGERSPFITRASEGATAVRVAWLLRA